MSVEINGLDDLKSKLKAMPQIMRDAAWDATFDLTEEVASSAASNLQSSVKHGSGELAASIKNEVVVDGKGNLLGRVWSDKDTAMYRELGTGPVGDKSPKDLPPGINPTYTQKRWFIPVDKVAIDLEAVYGIPRVKIKEQEFFMTSGQPARPWLYPALKEVKETATSVYEDHIRKGLSQLGR